MSIVEYKKLFKREHYEQVARRVRGSATRSPPESFSAPSADVKQEVNAENRPAPLVSPSKAERPVKREWTPENRFIKRY